MPGIRNYRPISRHDGAGIRNAPVDLRLRRDVAAEAVVRRVAEGEAGQVVSNRAVWARHWRRGHSPREADAEDDQQSCNREYSVHANVSTSGTESQSPSVFVTASF